MKTSEGGSGSRTTVPANTMKSHGDYERGGERSISSKTEALGSSRLTRRGGCPLATRRLPFTIERPDHLSASCPRTITFARTGSAG